MNPFLLKFFFVFLPLLRLIPVIANKKIACTELFSRCQLVHIVLRNGGVHILAAADDLDPISKGNYGFFPFLLD